MNGCFFSRSCASRRVPPVLLRRKGGLLTVGTHYHMRVDTFCCSATSQKADLHHCWRKASEKVHLFWSSRALQMFLSWARTSAAVIKCAYIISLRWTMSVRRQNSKRGPCGRAVRGQSWLVLIRLVIRNPPLIRAPAHNRCFETHRISHDLHHSWSLKHRGSQEHKERCVRLCACPYAQYVERRSALANVSPHRSNQYDR